MKHKFAINVALVSLLCATASTVNAQNSPTGKSTAATTAPVKKGSAASPRSPASLDAPARSAIVRKVCAILEEYYVYPDVAKKMQERLQERLRSGAYDDITAPNQFANLLTGDLIGVSHDRHLGIRFNPNGVPKGEAEMDAEQRARQNVEMKQFGETHNWGFVKAEVMPGNIGYLNLRFFAHPDWAGETAANAMAFLSRTDAMIIDVRENGGGYPQMVALLLSYLLERPSVHGGTEEIPLFLQNDRKAGTTTEIKTQLYVPGKKYLGKDVYLLTGRRSFSGAELFAQALKSNKRAILVGETTAGASHSMLTRPVTDHLEMAVSFGWTKDAVTGFDWEGKGITPDVPVPAQTALEKARLMALSRKADAAPPEQQRELKQPVAEAERALAAVQPKGPLDGNTTFRLKGHSKAKTVYLAGDFNRFDSKANPMVKAPDGDGWILKIDLDPGKYFYKFVVDGEWILDPDNPQKGPDPTGWESSLRTVAR